VHFAAESHVDRSIVEPSEFIRTNVLGTQVLLSIAIAKNVKQFLHVSTDEVYGSIEAGNSTETDPLLPNSPYAASKAASDLIVRSYYQTFGLDVRITRCCNNFGPNQFPEKFIPRALKNLKEGKKVIVYGNGKNLREWIHVEDHCIGIQLVIDSGVSGGIYNIGSSIELSNLELANLILEYASKPSDWIEFVEDRKGHDYRYSLNSNLIKSQLGFKTSHNFAESLRVLVNSVVIK
jgi:dTDP-glucose 4,6-dehydratase